MNKQQKIDRIYEVIADKTLSFGCKVICFEVDFGHSGDDFIKTFGTFSEEDFKPAYCKKADGDEDGLFYDNKNVIGHPVMIGDVLDWMQKNHRKREREYENEMSFVDNIYESREHKRKPIEDQSEKCIDLIISILQNE